MIVGRSLAEQLRTERALPVGPMDKAAPSGWYGLDTAQVVARGDRLSALGTPLMTLTGPVVEHNVAAMAAWCAERGVLLAPHGKTTMAPALWDRQLAAGAWGITVANEPQLRVALAAGAPRVVVANVLGRPQGLRELAAALDGRPQVEVLSWVDGVAGVRRADEALAGHEGRPLDVLVELGSPGARTGARSVEEGVQVAEAVLASDHLRLRGVAGYEGSLTHGVGAADLAAVDEFLGSMLELHGRLTGRYPAGEVVLSAGGSAYFDRVAAVLGPVAAADPTVRVVLRSGAYVSHDDGIYRVLTPSTRGAGPAFGAALHAWARVLSVPEPGLAYLDAGRRDLPADEGWPEPQVARRGGIDGPAVDLTGVGVRTMNDQHTHLLLPPGCPLAVGDVVRLGISHPCTAFDKWPLIPVVDDHDGADPQVVDLVRTWF